MTDFDVFHKSYKFDFTDKDISKFNNNQYLSIDHDGLMYIRDFCNFSSHHLDIDNYYADEEIKDLNENIIANMKSLNAKLDFSKYLSYETAYLLGSKASIFPNKSKKLVVGINESLRKFGDNLHLYVGANPNKSCLDFLPKKINNWPEGVFSYKVNPKFLHFYRGAKTGFNFPTYKLENGLLNFFNHHFCLEDHRSVGLSALNLLFLIGVKNIVMCGIENYIEEERPGTVYINKGVYMYPSQIIEYSIISAGAYWLNKFGINVYTTNQRFNFVNHISVTNEEI